MSNKKILTTLNQVNYIGYFLIKEDREKLDPKVLTGTLTEKILNAKEGSAHHISSFANLIAAQLPRKPLIIVPFPSTNKEKAQRLQLPYLLSKRMAAIHPGWEDGAGVLYRKYSLPKNTRDKEMQYKSLSVIADRIKDKSILLLDDVTTSGSSLMAGLKKIQEAKAKRVFALALAKKVYSTDIALTALF